MPEPAFPAPAESSFACRRCGQELRSGRGAFYLVKILAIADPSPPILEAQDDVAVEIQRLLKQVARLSESALLEEVYRRRLFTLCASCYRQWIADPFSPSQ